MTGLPTPALRKAGAGVHGEGTGDAEERLLRVDHMFEPHRDSELMRELRVLAARCAREGLVRA